MYVFMSRSHALFVQVDGHDVSSGHSVVHAFVQAQINSTTRRHIDCSSLRDVAYRSKACRKSRHIVQVSFGRPIDASNFLTNAAWLNVSVWRVSNRRGLEERG